MRYIGGKSLLVENIYKIIKKNTENVQTITDIFSGSGIVGQFLKKQGFSVLSNDFLYFAYVIARGTITNNPPLIFSDLGISDPFAYLNSLKISDTSDCFIYKNYSPNKFSNRMYFQNDNAIKIDLIRLTIEKWKNEGFITDDEYYYFLACLLYAVSSVANCTGTFSAYLKFWEKRSYDILTLVPYSLIHGKKCFSYWSDYENILGIKTDLLYADPPYTTREYLPNYHILETIARYDNPKIFGKTGLRNYSDEEKSLFCKKKFVAQAFETLLQKSHSRYILISYSNDGLLSIQNLSDMCQDYAKTGTFKLTEVQHRRYKSKFSNNKRELKEYLFFMVKK